MLISPDILINNNILNNEDKKDQNYFTKINKFEFKKDLIAKMNKNRRIMIVDDEPYNILGL